MATVNHVGNDDLHLPRIRQVEVTGAGPAEGAGTPIATVTEAPSLSAVTAESHVAGEGQEAVIRHVTQGINPSHQKVSAPIPFNLMKSEQMIWAIDDVDYLETVTRRERRGSSHGVSIRVTRGLYYRPLTFRSRAMVSLSTSA